MCMWHLAISWKRVVCPLVCFVFAAAKRGPSCWACRQSIRSESAGKLLRQPRRHPFYLIQCIIAIHVGDKTCQKHSPESSATTLWWLTRSEMSTRWPVRNQFPRRAILLITGLTECVQSERERAYVPMDGCGCAVRPWRRDWISLCTSLSPQTPKPHSAHTTHQRYRKDARAFAPLSPATPRVKIFETLPLLYLLFSRL